ncbi:putative disease resistance protein RGA4 isoform X1 [Coffea eugenioides]|uniref:putative disease resistance protein RGA4 isoform X1 n=1 Tax=Coffea eugenioides TaxID=49369 RepID=UPI000F6077F8|nr:putative disease resistance protein RGA4 isoform X1 [Coffea eugenioides]
MNRRRIEIQNQMKRKVSFFFFSRFNSIAFRCKMAKQIRKINMELQSINEEARNFGLLPLADIERSLSPQNRETGYVTIGTSFVGRDDDVSEIVAQLTATDNNETISVLPMVGMGGIGKTALARKVFNDSKIRQHFDERMWVRVSEDFNADKLFGLMLESVRRILVFL